MFDTKFDVAHRRCPSFIAKIHPRKK